MILLFFLYLSINLECSYFGLIITFFNKKSIILCINYFSENYFLRHRFQHIHMPYPSHSVRSLPSAGFFSSSPAIITSILVIAIFCTSNRCGTSFSVSTKSSNTIDFYSCRYALSILPYLFNTLSSTGFNSITRIK